MAHGTDDVNWFAPGGDETALQVDPEALRQTGARIADVSAALDTPTVGYTSITEETIGHAGLAAALNDFFGLAQVSRVELADHLDAMSTLTEHTARRYESTDTATARTLGQL